MTTTSRKRFWKRRRFWGVLLATPVVLLISALAVVGCMAGNMMAPGDETGLVRRTANLPLRSGEEIPVSYLLAPDAISSAHERNVPWLVYVHGTPGDATNWGAYLRQTVGGRPSVALDRPGFGTSAYRRAYPSFADQADAIAGLLVELNAEQAVLIGHSLGGPIIARVAAEHPERIAAIVIVAGSLDPELEKLKWYNYLLAVPLVDLLFPAALNHSNREVLAAGDETEELAKMLGDVRCRVFIVHGTADSLVPYANVAYMEQIFTNARSVDVTTLDDVDHFLIWTDEDVVRSVIDRAP